MIKYGAEVTKYEIRKVTIAGLIVNVFLVVFKFAFGYIGHSQALIADSVHSLSDLSTDIAIIFGVKYWLAPADKNHPYGHQKIELLITVFIAVSIAAAGIGILANAVLSVNRIKEPPAMAAFIVAVLSIISKELLYRYTIKKSIIYKSPALHANAWHHRSDAVSSLPVAAVIITAFVFPGLAFLDHLGAMTVSVFIIYPAYKMLKDAICSLLDESVDNITYNKISEETLKTKGVKSIHEIRSRKTGNAVFIDMHILVDGSISVNEGHEISELVKINIMLANENIIDVLVHIEPYGNEETEEK